MDAGFDFKERALARFLGIVKLLPTWLAHLVASTSTHRTHSHTSTAATTTVCRFYQLTTMVLVLLCKTSHLTGFVANVNNLWQFDSLFDAQGSGNELLVAHAGQNLSDINNSVNTKVLGGDVAGTTMSPLGVFTATATTVNGNTTITLSAANALVGAGQTVTGTGIPANTTVVSVSTTSVVISNAATASGTVTVTFDNNVSVSGGVVVLHPYVFVYGNNGLLKNSAAGDPNNWVSADSNETNVASTKVVQGLPVRGGSNAPSGLFWSLDSLIRVSYTPTTVTISGTPQTFYWRYDIISSTVFYSVVTVCD